ncbi:MAG: hypothetical protein IPL79_20415 [Myxococcales bacterium]|nr:hypothetical protein [Myxococcales bacterium]
MQITFIPQSRFDTLALSVAGDVLTVNGAALDLSPLPEGAVLPADAVACDWIMGDITRVGGVLHLAMLLPYGLYGGPAPEQQTITTDDGPITLPAGANDGGLA